MELKRRQFVALILAALGAAAAGLRTTVERATPARWRRAVGLRRYPGPLRTFTDEEIRRPSPRAG